MERKDLVGRKKKGTGEKTELFNVGRLRWGGTGGPQKAGSRA